MTNVACKHWKLGMLEATDYNKPCRFCADAATRAEKQLDELSIAKPMGYVRADYEVVLEKYKYTSVNANSSQLHTIPVFAQQPQSPSERETLLEIVSLRGQLDFYKNLFYRSLATATPVGADILARVDDLVKDVDVDINERLEPDDKGELLLALCSKFIADQGIICPEAIYQSDNVIQAAYTFIEDVCDIVGYFTDVEE